MLKPLLEKIAKPGISDLHLKANEPPLVRHLGKLVPIGTNAIRTEDIDNILTSLISPEQIQELNNRGDLDFSCAFEDIGRLRVNAYRQQGTIALAIRIIPVNCKTFEELNLPKDTMEKIARISRGLVLISGVTGAGKTTTLNAMIDYMNDNFCYNIITLEHPIEFSHHRKKSSVSQREIGRDVKSVSDGLSYVIRQDPDVIVIGEMTDATTYQAAIEAAASGHLVLSTIHSSDTVDAMDRIINSFEASSQQYIRTQLVNVVKSIVSQRLVMDKKGKGVYPSTEVLFGTLQIKKLLLSNSMSEASFMLEKGGAYGMHTFDQDLFRMVEEGTISVDEAIDNATNPNDFRIKLQGQAGISPEAGK